MCYESNLVITSITHCIFIYRVISYLEVMLLGHKEGKWCFTEEAFWMRTGRDGGVPAVVTLNSSREKSSLLGTGISYN